MCKGNNVYSELGNGVCACMCVFRIILQQYSKFLLLAQII